MSYESFESFMERQTQAQLEGERLDGIADEALSDMIRACEQGEPMMLIGEQMSDKRRRTAVVAAFERLEDMPEQQKALFCLLGRVSASKVGVTEHVAAKAILVAIAGEWATFVRDVAEDEGGRS